MSLYFNWYFFPLWWVSCIVMLHLKVSPPHCWALTPSQPFLPHPHVTQERLQACPAFSSFQYSVLPDYYKFIVITVIVLITLMEAIRLYLGCMGNLQEKVGPPLP